MSKLRSAKTRAFGFLPAAAIVTLTEPRIPRMVVDGTSHRWRLRRRPTYSQGLCWSPCTYAVEHAEHTGTVLVGTRNQPHIGDWLERPSSPVLPSDVADAITLPCSGDGFRLVRAGRFTSTSPAASLPRSERG